jgi:hypothetical protein
MCNRVTKNGVDQDKIGNMVRCHRILPKQLKNPAIMRMLQHAMRVVLGDEEAGASWKTKDAKKADLTNWDANNLSLQNFYLNIERLGDDHKKIHGIPFEDLAIDVKRMPEGDDTLDLTRCVKHALGHPRIYTFPQDFQTLINLTGGPEPQTPEHIDQTSAERWKEPRPEPQVASSVVDGLRHDETESEVV